MGIYRSFTPYAQHIGDIPPDEELEAFVYRNAKTILRTLEGVSSCHDAVAAWKARELPGEVVRGHYYPSFEHSWLDMGTWILDLYPVGGCRPHLVAKDVAREIYLAYKTRKIKHPTNAVEGLELEIIDIPHDVGDTLFRFELSQSEGFVNPQVTTITWGELICPAPCPTTH